MKKLYIVDFKYQDTYEKNTISERWFLACVNSQEVHAIMKKNFKELKRYGYEGLGYYFSEISTTDNGFKICVK